MEVTEIKFLEFRNLHGTGTSYIRCLESSSNCSFNTVEQTIEYLKTLYQGFSREYVGVYSRWEYFNLSFSYNIIECLDCNDVNYFLSLFKNTNEIELGESKYFQINVKKTKDGFEIEKYIFTHINLTESTAQFIDENIAVQMLKNKLKILKK